VKWLNRGRYKLQMETEYREHGALNKRGRRGPGGLYDTVWRTLKGMNHFSEIASTVHDTFMRSCSPNSIIGGKHARVVRENELKVAKSVSARNALGRSEKEKPEIATSYGEVHPYGYFRFVNFGHVPPIGLLRRFRKFMEIDKSRMVQFLRLACRFPKDHPDRDGIYHWKSERRGELLRCG